MSVEGGKKTRLLSLNLIIEEAQNPEYRPFFMELNTRVSFNGR